MPDRKMEWPFDTVTVPIRKWQPGRQGSVLQKVFSALNQPSIYGMVSPISSTYVSRHEGGKENDFLQQYPK